MITILVPLNQRSSDIREGLAPVQCNVDIVAICQIIVITTLCHPSIGKLPVSLSLPMVSTNNTILTDQHHHL